METHPQPEQVPSDCPNDCPLGEPPRLPETLLEIDRVVKRSGISLVIDEETALSYNFRIRFAQSPTDRIETELPAWKAPAQEPHIAVYLHPLPTVLPIKATGPAPVDSLPWPRDDLIAYSYSSATSDNVKSDGLIN